VVGVGSLVALLCAMGVVGAVVSAVHHTEVARRTGDPFGTLVLAIAVTVIAASLILSSMFAGGQNATVAPRDTLYAAVMIICSGFLGLCILFGGLWHHEQSFRVEGSGAGPAALVAMTVLVLVLPYFTTTTSTGTYSTSHLVFTAVVAAALWAVFVFIQTVRHPDYFLPGADASNIAAHAKPQTNREAWASFGLLWCHCDGGRTRARRPS
jgi:Ca2+:H+ antiporter